MDALVAIADMNDVVRLVADSARLVDGSSNELDPDAARLARDLKHAGRRRVGLLPATEGVSVAGLARILGRALFALTERTILLVDPERVSAPADAAPSGAPIEGFWIGPGVVGLCPFAVAPPGAKFESLKLLVQLADRDADAWGHALLDLSGCVRPGELLGAFSVLDGVVVVGQVGRSTDDDLRRASRALPPDVGLGVLLVE